MNIAAKLTVHLSWPVHEHSNQVNSPGSKDTKGSMISDISVKSSQPSDFANKIVEEYTKVCLRIGFELIR